MLYSFPKFEQKALSWCIMSLCLCVWLCFCVCVCVCVFVCQLCICMCKCECVWNVGAMHYNQQCKHSVIGIILILGCPCTQQNMRVQEPFKPDHCKHSKGTSPTIFLNNVIVTFWERWCLPASEIVSADDSVWYCTSEKYVILWEEGGKVNGRCPQVIYCHKPDICMLNSSEYSMQPLLQLGLRYREIINLWLMSAFNMRILFCAHLHTS